MTKISGGYYIKARCIKNSAIANSPPYVREIWDYLLREANHKDNKYSGYTLKRGQLFRSYRDIRDALSWKVGYRTERYNENQTKMGMRYLMKQLMITVAKQPRGNIITILNYDYFQNPKNYEATNETTSDTTTIQPMGNQGVLSINKKKKNDKNVKKDTAFDNAEIYITRQNRKITGKRLETFMLFWEAFNYKRGKAEATDVWLDIQPLTNSIVERIIATAKKESQRRPDLRKNDITPKMAQGWLSGKRWEDEIESPNQTQKIYEPE